jgi:predicted RNase H-like HicB family nuclease
VKVKVIIHPDETGGFWAEVPGLPGCVSEGETLDEVRANIREAFEGVFEVLQDEVLQDRPAETEPGQVEVLDV